jgi:ribosomal protein S18 acetylase RimI-like enzyme
MATYFRQLGSDDTLQLADHLVRWHQAEGRLLDPGMTSRRAARVLGDNQGWHVWLIEYQEQVVGYLAVNFRPGAAREATRAYVSGLYVAPEFRHLGLGRAARHLVSDLGRWLQIRVFEFETQGESKHAVALTRHASPVETDTSFWQASA